MAPFSVADLKSKAVKAKDASVSKLSTTRDRMKSTPSAQTGFDPYVKRTPPPPPPLRSTSSRSVESSSSASVSARPPPPVHHTSRPEAAPPPVLPRRNPSTIDHSNSFVRAYGDKQRESADRIDWSNLSTEDKQAFFSWLDEFFSQYLGRPVGPISAGVHPTPEIAGSGNLSASWRRTLPPPLAPLTGPPRPNLSTKPLSASFENM